MTKEIEVDVAIIGAGSAGLSAFHLVKKHTDRVAVIHSGPHGTTCARVGCMPSKVLIQVANDFYRRGTFKQEGIHGGEGLELNVSEAMKFVRKLRDRFVRGVMGTVEEIGDRLVDGKAVFLEPTLLQVNDRRVRAKSVILATGSTPRIPDSWASFQDRVLTSDSIFEQEGFSKRILVVGSGVIGLELGQALHRMGFEIKIVGRTPRVGGLSDPEINSYAIQGLQKELDLEFTKNLEIEKVGDELKVRTESGEWSCDQILSAMGRDVNVKGIGLEELGVSLSSRGVPEYDRETLQIGDLPVFICGDVTNELPILHEASDEGKIAAFNAIVAPARFKRRTPIQVVFSDPNIAAVGKSFKDLEGKEFHTGQVTFEGQGRSIVMSKEKGLLNVYGEPTTGKLLGAELMAPSGEHLAHLLSWAVQRDLTVFDVLKLPFYHPVVEEGLRTALRDLAVKVDAERAKLELDYKLI